MKNTTDVDPLACNRLLGGVSDEWMSIATAPRDGTKILACNADGDMAICHWDDVSMSGDKGWQISVVATDWNYYEELHKATHWMPRPDCPKVN